MKFEDYLKDHKEELHHKLDKDAIWDRISDKIPPAKNDTNYKLFLFGSATLIIILILILFYRSQKIGEQTDSTNQELIALKSERLGLPIVL